MYLELRFLLMLMKLSITVCGEAKGLVSQATHHT